MAAPDKLKKNDYITRMLITIDPRRLSARGMSCYAERFARQYDQMTPAERERAERVTTFS